MRPADSLHRQISEHAAGAPTLLAFRQSVLERLAGHVEYEAALFHDLSPRAPLERAAIVGLELGVLSKSTRTWDDSAVALGRLRDLALANGGVTTDAEAFPRGGRGRTQWDERVNRAFGVRATLAAHLVVRQRIVSVLLLFRRTKNGFTEEECNVLRDVVPVIAIADALHQALAGPSTGLPTALRCVDQRLTPRQQDLVERVALGHTNAQIGEALHLSPNTVRNALTAARLRVGAANRADLVRLAVLR